MTLTSMHPSLPSTADEPVLAGSWRERLQFLAEMQPNRPAFRHRRAGTWRQWFWRDLVLETERLSQGLQAYGVGPGQTVAVQGDLTPRMLLLALAARFLGAELQPVPRQVTADAIGLLVRRRGILHAVVGSAVDRASWQASGTTTFLFIPEDQQATRGRGIGYRLLRAGWGGTDADERRVFWPGRHGRTVWVEESTDWSAAPEAILRYWLDLGVCMTFPASLDWALADRRRIRPHVLLLSIQRLHALDVALQAVMSDQPRPSEAAALRRHLGLARTVGIEVLDDVGLPVRAAGIPPSLRARLGRLGIPLGDDQVRQPSHARDVDDPLILPLGYL